MTVGSKFYVPIESLNIWQWNAKYTDFSMCSAHETNIKTKFDPELMPLWKEPSEALTDLMVREIIVLKPSRAMATETLDLNAVRYHVAVDPQNILFVGADEKWAELFFKKRVVLGMRVNTLTDEKFRSAKIAGTRIEFDDCDVTVDYPGSRSVAKGFGYGLVIGSEVSMWRGYVADMLRKRLATHRFGHLLLESSPDPAQTRSSKEDPIFVEYNRGDQRQWHCLDPESNQPFTFQLGAEKGPGIKWDQNCRRPDGSWDYDAVARSAYYETPSGYRIYEKDRLPLVRSGFWLATNDKAPSSVRSYKVCPLAPPFYTAEIGHLAVEFLKAKAAGGQAMRTYKYEYWADEYEEQNPLYIADWSAVWQFKDQLNFPRGTIPFNGWMKLILTIDVQKNSVPFAVWAINTHGVYLIDHGTAINFDDMTNLIEKDWLRADGSIARVNGVVIDTGHKPDDCYRWIKDAQRRCVVIPVKGNEMAITGGEIYKWGLPLQNHPWVRILSIHSTHWHDLVFRVLTKVEASEGETFDQAWAKKRPQLYFHSEIDSAYARELSNEWVEEEINESTGAIRRIAKQRSPHDQFDLLRYVLIARSMMSAEIDAQLSKTDQVKNLPQQKAPIKQPEKPNIERIERYDFYEDNDGDSNSNYYRR